MNMPAVIDPVTFDFKITHTRDEFSFSSFACWRSSLKSRIRVMNLCAALESLRLPFKITHTRDECEHPPFDATRNL